MKLRDEVKIIIAFLIIILYVVIDSVIVNKSIEDCLNKGINENVCEELRR